ncbi:integrin beta-1-like [Dreissena polymorpha]|nr:integrin beta-1-like [Dreissena polymorpha]
MDVRSIIAVFGLFCLVDSQSDEAGCNQKRYCNDCINFHPDCAWCNDKEFAKARCSVNRTLKDDGCREIKNPNNTEFKTKNDGLKDGSFEYDPIQLTPQAIKLTLRKGKTHSLLMTYRVAKNLPIDIYFVMDASYTMATRIKDVADRIGDLIDGLKKSFTENIEIGFGVFIDKPVQPFTITTPRVLENPCLIQSTVCEPTYGFIHRQRLNNNTSEFIDTIRNTSTSSNFDPMEGGLDAVMQAAVCPQIVGWRNRSRRVLVYISDAGFHFAGDGKLGGIDLPNDATCHMVPNVRAQRAIIGEYIYSHSKILDYPSYGMLAKALKDNNINAFFLVDKSHVHLYQGLTDMIDQSKTMRMDATGSQGVVKQINDYYKELSERVKITGVNLPPELHITVATNCSVSTIVNTYKLPTDTKDMCTNLVVGKEVIFNVSVTLTECPKEDVNRTFKLVPSGLQEHLEIEVDYSCDCDCEKSAELDDKCSNKNGTYECGMCRCKPGRYGEFCQCSRAEGDTTEVMEGKCIKDNRTKKICEDLGTCECGVCKCQPNYEGTYCECNNNPCINRTSGEKCSNRGTCVCGQCRDCKDDYYGKLCECPPEQNCINAENGLTCSGHGKCECGACVCERNYEGPTCNLCPKCDRCRKCGYRECVQCLDQKGSSALNSSTACPVCEALKINRVDRFSDIEPCGYIDAEKCETHYVVDCVNNDVFLNITKGKICSLPPDPLLIALPLLGGILGVGILLLIIWKILTFFYDRIEYARLEHEIQNAKWSNTENPIYLNPVTKIENPCYTGDKD